MRGEVKSIVCFVSWVGPGMEGLSDIIDQTRLGDEFVSYHHHAQHFLHTGMIIRLKISVFHEKITFHVTREEFGELILHVNISERLTLC